MHPYSTISSFSLLQPPSLKPNIQITAVGILSIEADNPPHLDRFSLEEMPRLDLCLS